MQCQKDDTNTNVESEQLKKELSKTELEKRAREIVSSKKHQKFTNQTDLFLSKIHNKNFLTERIIDEENQTYRYDLIEERLSMTSFSSVEEFIQEYEKLFYSAQKLMVQYPSVANSSMQERIREEILKKANNGLEMRGYKCRTACFNDFEDCQADARGVYNTAIFACVCVIGANIPAGCACVITATIAYNYALRSCGDHYESCTYRCH